MSNGGSAGGGPAAALTAVSTGLDVVKKAQELSDGNLTYSFDKQTKRARKTEDCECPAGPVYRAPIRLIRFRNIFGIDLARVRLNARWEANGCDVIGAIGFLGSSAARLGWSADVRVVSIDTDRTVAPRCECCQRGVGVAFTYTIVIDPALQATRTYSGEFSLFADGSYTTLAY